MMEVEKMKEIVNKRIKSQVIILSLALLIMNSRSLFTLLSITGDSYEYTEPFQAILSALLIFTTSIRIFKNSNLLKDNEALKAKYIEENNPHNKLLIAKIGIEKFMWTEVALILSAVIIGYFSIVAFIALCGVILAESIAMMLINRHYKKQFI